MPPNTVKSEEKQRYPYLDALRGIAILLIILFHTTIFMVHPATNFLYRISGEGARGVQLFFIISALTLFTSLSRNSFSGKRMEKIKFFFRRFFRIAPMFYIMIGVFSILALTIFFYKPGWLNLNVNLWSIVTSITFTNNFVPQYMNVIVPGQWFIAVEIFFCFITPFLFLRIKNLRTAKKYFVWSLVIACLIELVLPLLFPANISENIKTFLFYSVPIQLPTFMLGFVVFFLLFKKDQELKPISYMKEFMLLLETVFTCEIAFVIIKFLITHSIDISIATPRVYIESVCFLGVILLFSKGYAYFLQNKVLQYIGKISYSIYLIHFISFIIITKNNLYPGFASHFTNDYVEYIFLFIATSILSIIIASITFRYIELPGQKLGTYLFKKITNRQGYPQK